MKKKINRFKFKFNNKRKKEENNWSQKLWIILNNKLLSTDENFQV